LINQVRELHMTCKL